MWKLVMFNRNSSGRADLQHTFQNEVQASGSANSWDGISII